MSKTLNPQAGELPSQWSRRQWLKAMGAGGLGLVVGIPLSGCSSTADLPHAEGGASLGAFLQIAPDNSVHFYQPRAEMGQGVYTGMTTLIAEELGVAPEAMHVHLVGAHPAFVAPGAPAQVTGGSTSVKAHYTALREAGAQAREAIAQAAAQALRVDRARLRLADGQVFLGDQAYPYGRFAAAAAAAPLPEGVALKPTSAFEVIGKPRVALDGLAKATGSASFGLDVQVPGMRYAALQRCPVVGGRLSSVDEGAVRAMPGVVSVVRLPHAVAVVAENTWQARQAAAQLKPTWDLPPLAQHSSEGMRADMARALGEQTGASALEEGDVDAALSQSAQRLEAQYWAPHLAHATMEPMNCTAHVHAGRCEVWVGTQSPDLAAAVAAHFADVAPEQVTIHAQFLGGGFGRRVNTDYVAEAVQVARAAGVPVQVVWSREDDMRADYYRPSSLMQMRGGLDAQGRVQALSAKRAGANAFAHFVDDAGEALFSAYVPWGMAEWLSERGYWLFESLTVDNSSVEGLLGDYQVPARALHHVTVDHGVRLGFWRSVGHSFSAFAIEGFIDELAHAAGQDPVAFRLAHLQHDPRLAGVLRQAAERAGWGQAPAGHFQGVAAHRSFETAVAQVVDLVVQDQRPIIKRITCVVDCGVAVNPDIVVRQMESAIVYGLSAALMGEVTFQNGVAQQSNFHDYPVLRMDETPEIVVHLVPSSAEPTGVGEPGLPPVAPAVANAWFAATGQRLRELPLRMA
jgi:CO/xanthine dehydrogenase Mo-binding subunit